MPKRRKIRRLRGSNSHGWGKQHRGSGQRGGVGRAGSGKKADQGKPSIWKKRYFGKVGFVSKGGKRVVSVNVGVVDQLLESWVASKKVGVENGVAVVDLKKLGFDKLLGFGNISRRVRIRVARASSAAVEKVKAAGGEVLVE